MFIGVFFSGDSNSSDNLSATQNNNTDKLQKYTVRGEARLGMYASLTPFGKKDKKGKITLSLTVTQEGKVIKKSKVKEPPLIIT